MSSNSERIEANWEEPFAREPCPTVGLGKPRDTDQGPFHSHPSMYQHNSSGNIIFLALGVNHTYE